MGKEQWRVNDKSYWQLRAQVKFLKRYLKEKGLFKKYFLYIHNPKTYNQFQKSFEGEFTFKLAVEYLGVKDLISRLISWVETEEGYSFWKKVYDDFRQKFTDEFGF